VDSGGNLYIAVDFGSLSKFISKITPDGIISTIGGSPTSMPGYSGDGGPATNAQFNFSAANPVGMAVDSAGNIYIADTDNVRVRKISPDGTITTAAGGGTLSVSLTGVNIGDGGPATAAFLSKPEGLAVDSANNLYIADEVGQRIRKVSTDGTITTVAGCAGSPQCPFALGDGGPATSAMLLPSAVAVDSDGSLYIAERFNNRIRKVSTDGTITTVVGSGAGSFQGDGGPATQAGLYVPSAVAVDSAGNLFVDDAGDYRIRMVTPDGTISTIAGNGAQRQPGDTTPYTGSATDISLGRFTSGLAVGSGGTVYFADDPYGFFLLTPN
jgi:sugar lactone lactonase YvrE